MPEVGENETKEEWMGRCVSAVQGEGRTNEQAVAQCLSMWRRAHGESEPGGKAMNALKTISRDDEVMRCGNYIVLFGDESRRDLEGIASANKNGDGTLGEFFTERTELESGYTKTGRLLMDWEHGRDGAEDAPGEDDPLGYVDWSTAKTDTRGVWVERALFRHNEYVKWLEELIDAGIVSTSSEAIPGKVRKAESGEIVRWPLRRDTLTVTPMEWRNKTENVIRAAKALGIDIANAPPPPEAEPEGAKASASAAGQGRMRMQLLKNRLTMEG